MLEHRITASLVALAFVEPLAFGTDLLFAFCIVPAVVVGEAAHFLIELLLQKVCT
jgi:hypothetical protein